MSKYKEPPRNNAYLGPEAHLKEVVGTRTTATPSTSASVSASVNRVVAAVASCIHIGQARAQASIHQYVPLRVTLQLQL